jgi:hypothetical protein
MTAADRRSPSAGFQAVLTVAAKCLQPDGIVHGLEQQSCCVQVVERVGLVAKYFSDHYDSSSKTY